MNDIVKDSSPRGRSSLDDVITDDELNLLMSALSYSSSSSGYVCYDAFLSLLGDCDIRNSEDSEVAATHAIVQFELFSKAKLRLKDLLKPLVKLDKKGKGFLRRTEFERALSSCCSKLNSGDVEICSGRWDLNSEGVVDYYGFVYWIAMGSDKKLSLAHIWKQAQLINDSHVKSQLRRNVMNDDEDSDPMVSKSGFFRAMRNCGFVMSWIEMSAVWKSLAM